MAEDLTTVKNFSATSDKFRAVAESTGQTLLKRLREDSDLEKKAKLGFDAYDVKLLGEDLENLMTQFKVHVCGTRPVRKKYCISYTHFRNLKPCITTMVLNGISYGSSPVIFQRSPKVLQKISGCYLWWLKTDKLGNR
jgi:hypothetical protein